MGTVKAADEVVDYWTFSYGTQWSRLSLTHSVPIAMLTLTQPYPMSVTLMRYSEIKLQISILVCFVSVLYEGRF